MLYMIKGKIIIIQLIWKEVLKSRQWKKIFLKKKLNLIKKEKELNKKKMLISELKNLKTKIKEKAKKLNQTIKNKQK